VLRDRQGDVNKRWYIEFYTWSFDRKSLVRKQMFVPMSLSAKERKAWAKPRIKAIADMLESGYSIPSKKKQVIKPGNRITAIEALQHCINSIG
jgi:hypothetical protein